jgi:hypothetical protein
MSRVSRFPFGRLLLAGVILTVLAVVFSFLSPPAPRPEKPAAVVAPLPVTSAPPQAKPKEAPVARLEHPDHSPLADELNAPGNTPQRDLEILKGLLGQFTTVLKPGNAPPLGDNQDITAALTGHNKLHIVFIPPNHPAIDAQGRLLDRWGTPYFFHARSAETFDLRSAGPDKILFTADDVVRTWK